MRDDVILTAEQAMLLHQAAMTGGLLLLWVVTWNTSDYPHQAIARPTLIGHGTYAALAKVILAASLDELRQMLPAGLTPMDRHPNDDPVIIEVWL